MDMHGKLWYLRDGLNSCGFSNPWLSVGLRVAGFIVIVALAIYIAKRFSHKNSMDDEVIQILKLKFVNGEINEDEYKMKLDSIRKK
jgi:uncharacterized membrane protein